jgi:hypothetical protein
VWATYFRYLPSLPSQGKICDIALTFASVSHFFDIGIVKTTSGDNRCRRLQVVPGPDILLIGRRWTFASKKGGDYRDPCFDRKDGVDY